MLTRKNEQTIYNYNPETEPVSMLIKNGRVIDPANSIDEVLSITLDKGRILSMSQESPTDFHAESVIDAQGLWVVPGLVDLHVHLREPGGEDKETIETGSQAAAAGGFTALACMPNTTPTLDDGSKISFVKNRAKNCPCRIYPVGSITRGLHGVDLSPLEEMVQTGALAISDDGRSVENTFIMRKAFAQAKILNIPVLCHCEDIHLVNKGHMNEGLVSQRHGIRGIPTLAEDICVARDILIAEFTDSRVHICHVSTAGAVDIIRQAKKRGVSVTCETCPHYFVFSDEDLDPLNTHKKMNPPLRTPKDRDAIVAGLKDGTIDCLASDHAPHCPKDKNGSFEDAAFGVIGLETMVSSTISYLINNNVLTPAELIYKMSVKPNQILNLPGGSLAPQSPADITIIDPTSKWIVDPTLFYSKGRNTPFEGMEMTGFAKYTIMGGVVVFERD